MHRKTGKTLVQAGMAVIVFAASTLVVAQTLQPLQLAANTATAPASTFSGYVAPTTAALQARIDNQQQEINRLSRLVEKLQAMMEPVASAQPILPNAAIGFLPPGGMPAGAPPAPTSSTFTPPRELLPDIGHIGAELGFFAGGATNPYKADSGFATGGYIDLPWKNVPGGKLSYEIMIGLQRSVTSATTTSGVNVLANAVTNAYLGNTAGNATSLTSYLAGPLPITSVVEERAKVLTVAPFELKYAITKLGRFRPYLVGGLGAYVWIGSDNNSKSFDAVSSLNAYSPGLANVPVGSSTLGATLNALLKGSQIGGLAPTAPELANRGVPHGQGNLLFGGQIGGGFEVRVSPKVSIGADFRHNQLEGSNSGFNTFTFKQGLHW